MRAGHRLLGNATQGSVAGVAAVAASMAAGGLSLRASEAFLILFSLGSWTLIGCLWAAAYHIGQAQTDATHRWGTMVAAGIIAGAALLHNTAAASLLGPDPTMALANDGWKLLPALLAREIVRLLGEPAGIYDLIITPTLFMILLAARRLAPANVGGRRFRTLAMAMGGLVSGLLTKPLLMLMAPNSIHGPHVFFCSTIFVAFAVGLSLGEALAHKLDPPAQEPDNDFT